MTNPNPIPTLTTSPNGSKLWYLNGNLHREDGPAFEYNGTKAWYLKGLLHRKDGPAVEHNGTKAWYLNGLLHREDGPAIEYSDGRKEWYTKGKYARLLAKSGLMIVSK